MVKIFTLTVDVKKKKPLSPVASHFSGNELFNKGFIIRHT